MGNVSSVDEEEPNKKSGRVKKDLFLGAKQGGKLTRSRGSVFRGVSHLAREHRKHFGVTEKI